MVLSFRCADQDILIPCGTRISTGRCAQMFSILSQSISVIEVSVQIQSINARTSNRNGTAMKLLNAKNVNHNWCLRIYAFDNKDFQRLKNLIIDSKLILNAIYHKFYNFSSVNSTFKFQNYFYIIQELH